MINDAPSGNNSNFTIRVPLMMVQITEPNGSVLPISFDWTEPDGQKVNVTIDRVVSITPEAEIKSGAVGDRYDCEIMGKRELLYYSKLAPRKWFKILPVSEQEYNAYYPLPGEA